MIQSEDIKRMADDKRIAELKMVVEQRDTTIEFLKKQCDFLKPSVENQDQKKRTRERNQ